MKLRNKITGEIKEVIVGGYPVSGKTKMWECSEMDANEETGYKSLGTYSSLAELNEEWEDYKEPKEHYFITEYGGVYSLNEYEGLNNVANPEDYRAIGNYFETEEEARKAVEKLKAWKRLKDKGFRFTDYDYTTYRGKGCGQVFFNGVIDNINEIKADLDLLFGGEE